MIFPLAQPDLSGVLQSVQPVAVLDMLNERLAIIGTVRQVDAGLVQGHQVGQSQDNDVMYKRYSSLHHWHVHSPQS